jgi:hypothetical protein
LWWAVKVWFKCFAWVFFCLFLFAGFVTVGVIDRTAQAGNPTTADESVEGFIWMIAGAAIIALGVSTFVAVQVFKEARDKSLYP